MSEVDNDEFFAKVARERLGLKTPTPPACSAAPSSTWWQRAHSQNDDPASLWYMCEGFPKCAPLTCRLNAHGSCWALKP